MIQALIVDDETIVRKGLITMMPWEKFGVAVAGEAIHGRRALDVLAKKPIDLLFTDLMMPEMNGIELMKRVKAEYPDTAVVVLTCHQDFQYIQEALRLGAIDYILKTQIENEVMEEVLGRIVERYKELSSRSRTNEDALSGGCLFVSDLHDTAADDRLHEAFGRGELSPTDRGTWFLPIEREEDDSFVERWLESPDGAGWIVVRAEGRISGGPQAVKKALNRYAERDLFYEYRTDSRHYVMPLTDTDPSETESPGETPTSLEPYVAVWSSLQWAADETYFHSALAALKSSGLRSRSLRQLFCTAIMEWNLLIVSVEQASEWMQGLERLWFWEHWSDWLQNVRQRVRHDYRRSQYPDEIVAATLRAIEYMRHQSRFDFTQEQIAAVANMSRAYFSICFKQITGKGFFEYVRQLRISLAKRLLLTTSKPIYAIAAQTGFRDERYFSKMFLSEVGVLPSEFRQRESEGFPSRPL